MTSFLPPDRRRRFTKRLRILIVSDLQTITDKSKFDREYYDRLAQEYFDRHEQPIQRYSTRIEEQWLTELVPTGARVLLVGVGGGRELTVLLGRECTITALDYSAEMIEAGRRRWGDAPIEWVLGDAHDLGPFRERFDVVISLAAINYFVDVSLALREMTAALVPGGKLIVSSINALHPSERNAKSGGKVTRILYAPQELADLAAAEGAALVELRGIRYLADNLPPAWNRPKANALQRAMVRIALWLEPLWSRMRTPERAKFFWLIAERR